jgi:hypothetical protein
MTYVFLQNSDGDVENAQFIGRRQGDDFHAHRHSPVNSSNRLVEGKGDTEIIYIYAISNTTIRKGW